MSRAQFIFDEIQKEGISYIENLVRNQITEELFLDYKCVRTQTGAAKLEAEDRKNFGKAVSGFGNSDGGVVIWGVDYRKVAGQGDIPTGFQADTTPLQGFSPTWFKSMLEGLTSGVTVPSHQGVVHFSLDRPGRNDGVVATYIPSGSSVPFRSISDGNDVYYIRSGSDFCAAPHAVLSGLFGRRPQPVIEIDAHLAPDSFNGLPPQSDHPLWLTLDIALKNVGRGMADDLFMLIEVASTLFKCNRHPFNDKEWQITRDKINGWEGPRMVVTVPSARRLPPGGVLKFSFGSYGVAC